MVENWNFLYRLVDFIKANLTNIRLLISSRKGYNNDPMIFGMRSGQIAIIKVEKGWITARDPLIEAI